jgi:glutamate-1-semialdehyde 2,1-aminomutase
MVRMVNSGTEATMSAIRLARAFTGREKILKFEGCYHGHADSFLIKAGSGAMTLGIPDSPGVPAAIAGSTLTAGFNDIISVRKTLEHHAGTVAAVIVEPVVGNMGCIPPQPGFLTELRELCDAHSALLIFDEVMTGFRLAPGGAQELYAVLPDLTTMGKIIGGGLPVGAYGGRAEIMRLVAPSGPMYQAGTLSGNPLAMAAGRTLLRELKKRRSVYARLEKLGKRLEDGIARAQKDAGCSYTFNRVGSMFTLFFTGIPVFDFGSASSADRALFSRYFNHMLEHGILLPPSQFEAAFIPGTHTKKEIDRYLQALHSFLTGL